MAQAIGEPALLERPVRDVMEAPFPVVDSDLALERFSRLLSRAVPAVLIRTGGQLTGIITRYDVLHVVQGIH